MTSLNLTQNELKGQLPLLELFQGLRETLKCLDLSHNSISGSLALPPGITLRPWVQLEYFQVNDNRITGKVPLDWFELQAENSLLGVNMAWNLLSGELPSAAISNLGALKELYFSHNMLVGTIPSMTNLRKLGTRHRSFFYSLAGSIFSMEVFSRRLPH